MRARPYAAAMGLGLAFLAGCSGGSPESRPQPQPTGTAKLSDNPEHIKALAHTAVQQFEADIREKGHASVWIFAGMCAVIRSPLKLPHGHGTLYDLVPNPGVVHAKDTLTGEIVTQAIAWNKQAGRFVTGIIAVLDPKGKDSMAPMQTSHEQFNIGAEHSTLDTATMVLEPQFKQLVDADQGLLLMDVAATGEGKSAKAFAGRPEIQRLCQQATASPPTSPPGARV